jgi:aminoglycoside N3'-acetyltransferase
MIPKTSQPMRNAKKSTYQLGLKSESNVMLHARLHLLKSMALVFLEVFEYLNANYRQGPFHA